MKRLLFSLYILLSLTTANVFAQVPQITLGSIPANTLLKGVVAAVYTTREQIFKNPKLTGNDPHCVITGYTFSIISGTKSWTTHVKGDELTPKVIRKIKEMKGPGVKIYFDNIGILYDGKEASTNPVTLTYDE